MTLTGVEAGERAGNVGIDLDHISKRFGDNVVLDDVSLHVAPGTVTALIGPSGAGKSTFLRCINLLERPDSGDHPGGGPHHRAGQGDPQS